MTYSILSLASGNILESYDSESGALEAAARLCHSEPVATESVALVSFDDAGMPVESIDGEELAHRLRHAFGAEAATSF